MPTIFCTAGSPLPPPDVVVCHCFATSVRVSVGVVVLAADGRLVRGDLCALELQRRAGRRRPRLVDDDRRAVELRPLGGRQGELRARCVEVLDDLDLRRGELRVRVAAGLAARAGRDRGDAEEVGLDRGLRSLGEGQRADGAARRRHGGLLECARAVRPRGALRAWGALRARRAGGVPGDRGLGRRDADRVARLPGARIDDADIRARGGGQPGCGACLVAGVDHAVRAGHAGDGDRRAGAEGDGGKCEHDPRAPRAGDPSGGTRAQAAHGVETSRSRRALDRERILRPRSDRSTGVAVPRLPCVRSAA